MAGDPAEMRRRKILANQVKSKQPVAGGASEASGGLAPVQGARPPMNVMANMAIRPDYPVGGKPMIGPKINPPAPVVQPSAAPAPNPVSQPKPGSAGTGAAAASPMVPGMPQAGPAALNTPNDVQGRVAALDNQIRTMMQTRILNTPLGAPGREEVVNYVRQLKAEKDALARSTATGPNFLSAQDASAKQAQMIAVRRAELQRQLEATNQANAPGAGAADAQMAGKMELWKRGMGEQVLRDKSGELQRMAGSQFDPGQYVSSGGAYGTPGEKAGFGRGVAQNAERVRLQEALAALDKEQGDLDSGKYASDYAGRQGQRDQAMQRSQVQAAAARGEADRMKGQRDLATAEQTDAATFEKRQREIAMKMQEAQLRKMQNDGLVDEAMGKAGPAIAQEQAGMARAGAAYKGAGFENRSSALNYAREQWDTLIKPMLSDNALAGRGVVRGSTFFGSVDPRRADQFSAAVVDPIEKMAATAPDEARLVARNILSLMPAEDFSYSSWMGSGEKQAMAEKLATIKARLMAIAGQS